MSACYDNNDDDVAAPHVYIVPLAGARLNIPDFMGMPDMQVVNTSAFCSPKGAPGFLTEGHMSMSKWGLACVYYVHLLRFGELCIFLCHLVLFVSMLAKWYISCRRVSDWRVIHCNGLLCVFPTCIIVNFLINFTFLTATYLGTYSLFVLKVPLNLNKSIIGFLSHWPWVQFWTSANQFELLSGQAMITGGGEHHFFAFSISRDFFKI